MIVPLQLIDTFLLQFNVGQVLLVVYVLVMLGSIPLFSVRVLSLNSLMFGLVFIAAPNSLVPILYKMIGLGLLVLAPLLYTLSSR